MGAYQKLVLNVAEWVKKQKSKGALFIVHSSKFIGKPPMAERNSGEIERKI
jgi:hypothetical protein